MDLIVDRLATGRMVRILSVLDAYTRECLALKADTSLGSGCVTRVLDHLIQERGRPEAVRSDNGPEFTSRRMLGWAENWKVGLVHIITDHKSYVTAGPGTRNPVEVTEQEYVADKAATAFSKAVQTMLNQALA